MTSSMAVTSPDATPLVVGLAGDGEPVVLVHGAATSKASWALVQPLLAETNRTAVFDRRGRGDSGDGPNYSINAVSLPEAWQRICNALPKLGRELGELHTCTIFEGDQPLAISAPTLHIATA